MNPYLLGTGFFSKGPESHDFADVWADCLVRNIKTPPAASVCLSVGDSGFPPVNSVFLSNGWPGMQTLSLQGNCGHVGDLLNRQKPHDFCGWSAGVLALAMIAYNNETDLLYIEQDVIIKGDVLEQLLYDMGDAKFIFGKAFWMPCGQSLFYIKHDFIPKFVAAYITCGSDAHSYNLPESKFCQIEQMFPDECRRTVMGFDREKPIQWEDPVFYFQHATAEEMEEAKKRGLI